MLFAVERVVAPPSWTKSLLLRGGAGGCASSRPPALRVRAVPSKETNLGRPPPQSLAQPRAPVTLLHGASFRGMRKLLEAACGGVASLSDDTIGSPARPPRYVFCVAASEEAAPIAATYAETVTLTDTPLESSSPVVVNTSLDHLCVQSNVSGEDEVIDPLHSGLKAIVVVALSADLSGSQFAEPFLDAAGNLRFDEKDDTDDDSTRHPWTYMHDGRMAYAVPLSRVRSAEGWLLPKVDG